MQPGNFDEFTSVGLVRLPWIIELTVSKIRTIQNSESRGRKSNFFLIQTFTTLPVWGSPNPTILGFQGEYANIDDLVSNMKKHSLFALLPTQNMDNSHLNDFPCEFKVGASGFGLGVGCGVGVGFGKPLNLHSIPGVVRGFKSVALCMNANNELFQKRRLTCSLFMQLLVKWCLGSLLE